MRMELSNMFLLPHSITIFTLSIHIPEPCRKKEQEPFIAIHTFLTRLSNIKNKKFSTCQ